MIKGAEFLELSQEILASGRKVRFIATGMSMRPFIKHGDIIEIEPAQLASIKAGDVIFYSRLGGHGVVHRVIRKKKGDNGIILLTKGDALRGFDNTVAPQQVLGKVTKIERNGIEIKLGNFGIRTIGRIWAFAYPVSYAVVGLLVKAKRVLRRVANSG